jgi:hypothetical protein
MILKKVIMHLIKPKKQTKVKQKVLLPFIYSVKPCNQFRVQINIWTCSGSVELLYLVRTRPPILKDDSDATVVMGMLRISRAIMESVGNFFS